MKIRLNTILIAMVLMVLVFFFFIDKTGTYLYGSEPQIYLLITVTLASLILNIYFKSEFLEILNLVFVLFYICRIPFVFSNELASDVLLRSIDLGRIPEAINALTFQYFSLVACLTLVNPRLPRQRIRTLNELHFKKILSFAFLIILVNTLYAVLIWQYRVGTVSHILAISQTVFTLEVGLMLIILAATLVGKDVLAKYRLGVCLCLFFAVLCLLYQGNKSGLLQVMLIAYLARIVVSGPFVFRLHTLCLTMSLGLVSFALFFIGSAFRFYQRGVIGADEILYKSFNGIGNLSALFNGFSYRVGYLDFYIDKTLNPAYKPFVNFKYYFMSLTDKLTPGFDVFNVPFLSRTLYSTYFGQPTGGTNSEQITLFAESHLLLGYFSFLIYLPILFIFKRLLQRYKSPLGFAYGLFYMYVVSLFYSWVVGFGLDMLIAEAIYKGIFVFLTIWLIRIRFVSSNKIAENIL